MHTDGSPYLSGYYRQVSVQIIHDSIRGAYSDGEQPVIIPDDNILRIHVNPRVQDTRIHIRVSIWDLRCRLNYRE